MIVNTIATSARLLRSVCRSENDRQNAPAVRLAVARRNAEREGESPWRARAREWKHHLGECWRMMRTSLILRDAPSTPVQFLFSGHKSEAARRELVAAGLPEEMISAIEHNRKFRVMVLSPRSLVVAIRTLLLRFYLARRVRRAEAYLDVIFITQAMRYALRGLEPRAWVVVGDLSPSLIALCAAARDNGHRIITWQQDYLDFKRFPVVPDSAVVLNQKGVELTDGSMRASISREVFWRRGLQAQPMRLEIEHLPIGIMLNSQATRVELQCIERIREWFGGRAIIRFHPSSALQDEPLGPEVELSPAEEPLESFLARVGIVVSATTTTELKAVCLGTPVVHLGCLDRIGFPHLNYVERGIVIGFDTVQEVAMDAVLQFYREASYRDALRKLLGPQNHVGRAGLPELVELLRRLNSETRRELRP